MKKKYVKRGMLFGLIFVNIYIFSTKQIPGIIVTNSDLSVEIPSFHEKNKERLLSLVLRKQLTAEQEELIKRGFEADLAEMYLKNPEKQTVLRGKLEKYIKSNNLLYNPMLEKFVQEFLQDDSVNVVYDSSGNGYSAVPHLALIICGPELFLNYKTTLWELLDDKNEFTQHLDTMAYYEAVLNLHKAFLLHEYGHIKIFRYLKKAVYLLRKLQKDYEGTNWIMLEEKAADSAIINEPNLLHAALGAHADRALYSKKIDEILKTIENKRAFESTHPPDAERAQYFMNRLKKLGITEVIATLHDDLSEYEHAISFLDEYTDTYLFYDNVYNVFKTELSQKNTKEINRIQETINKFKLIFEEGIEKFKKLKEDVRDNIMFAYYPYLKTSILFLLNDIQEKLYDTVRFLTDAKVVKVFSIAKQLQEYSVFDKGADLTFDQKSLLYAEYLEALNICTIFIRMFAIKSQERFILDFLQDILKQSGNSLFDAEFIQKYEAMPV